MFTWNSQFRLDFNDDSADAVAVDEMAHNAGPGTTPYVPPNHRTDVEPYNEPPAPPPPPKPCESPTNQADCLSTIDGLARNEECIWC